MKTVDINGVPHDFPDDMSWDEIKVVLDENFGKKEISTKQAIDDTIRGAGRGAVKALGTVVTLPQDLVFAAGNYLTNQDLKPPFGSENLDKYVTEPLYGKTNSGYGRTAEDLSNLTFGGAVLGGLPGAVSGASSGALGSYVRENGGSPTEQMIGYLVGGIAPTGIQTAANATNSTAHALIDPFTKSGSQKIASKLVKNTVSNPEEIINKIDNPQSYVPGSVPTIAERTLSDPISAMDSAARKIDPLGFKQIDDVNQIARLNYLENSGYGKYSDALLKKYPGQFEKELISPVPNRADIIRQGAELRAGPIREKAFADWEADPRIPASNYSYAAFRPDLDKPSVNVNIPKNVAQEILNSPMANQDAVDKAVSATNSYLSNAQNLQNPRWAYEAKKGLDAAISNTLPKTDDTAAFNRAKSLAGGVSSKVKNSLSDEIARVAPGYAQYLAKSSPIYKMADRQQLLDEIANSAKAPVENAQTGDNFLRAAQLRNAMIKNADDITQKLSPSQQTALGNLEKDLSRSASVTNSKPINQAGAKFEQEIQGIGPVSKMLRLRLGGQGPSAVGRLSEIITPYGKTNTAFAEIMKDPEKFKAALMGNYPTFMDKFKQDLPFQNLLKSGKISEKDARLMIMKANQANQGYN